MDFRPEIVFPLCVAIIMVGLAWMTYIRLSKKEIMNKTLVKDLRNTFTDIFVAKKDCAKDVVIQRLDAGSTDFTSIKGELKKQGKMLERIDERTLLWSKKNGFEKRTKEANDGKS